MEDEKSAVVWRKKMGIAYYDQEIIKELMNRTEFAEEYIRHMDEKAPISLLPITQSARLGCQPIMLLNKT